ncbi:MAG: glycosyltransferase family 1 protein [Prevotella sp.]|nr:glycosyltransferase family 1 protein [Prevotella sp.]
MKILFLVYHGFSESSGITKKIRAQVKGLEQNGHEVHLCYYDFDSCGHRCRFVDGKVLQDYGTGRWAALRQRLSYGCVVGYCRREKIELVYARCFQNASPWLIRLFSRLRRMGVRAVTEVPTYPYDQEFVGSNYLPGLVALHVDKLFRCRLYRKMDAMVTFSDAEEIFGCRTIRISNGVDFDAIPLHRHVPAQDADVLHLIAVAEVHFWHGFDRLIAGMGEYALRHRSLSDERSVVLHIVGGVAPSEMQGSKNAPGFLPLIEKYGLQQSVVFHGQLFGNQLDDVFNQCSFAVGSLGRHRSHITSIKTLKNREYATRGLPFMYSEQDSDFDAQPYVFHVPADESPVDLDSLLHFIDSRRFLPEDIRRSVAHLSWRQQMGEVVAMLATERNG